MSGANQVTPGMTIELDGEIYYVESSIKVAPTKGAAVVKTKLRQLLTDKIIEKTLKPTQAIKEITLQEHYLEFLYPEKNGYLFLDIGNLEKALIPSKILKDKINYLKEGVRIKAMFFGGNIFSIDLPQFLEIMIAQTEETATKLTVSNATKEAILETGAKIQVPLFVEVGDIVKVDTTTNEFVQRV